MIREYLLPAFRKCIHNLKIEITRPLKVFNFGLLGVLGGLTFNNAPYIRLPRPEGTYINYYFKVFKYYAFLFHLYSAFPEVLETLDNLQRLNYEFDSWTDYYYDDCYNYETDVFDEIVSFPNYFFETLKKIPKGMTVHTYNE